MTLDDHKRLGASFQAVPRRYKFLCREHQGSISCAAAVLRAYVFATRERGDSLDLSETDLERLLDYDWSEKPIRAARAFLVRRGILVYRSHTRRGQRSDVAVDFDYLEELEAKMPRDWESQLTALLKAGQNGPTSQNGRVGQNSPTTTANLPHSGARSGAEVPHLSLLKELASSKNEEQLASPSPPPPDLKRAELVTELSSLFRGVQIPAGPRGAYVTPQTLAALVTEIRRLPEETWPLVLHQIAEARSRARTWGLFKWLVSQNRAAYAAQWTARQGIQAGSPISASAAREAQQTLEYDASEIERFKTMLAFCPNHLQAEEWREIIARKPVGSAASLNPQSTEAYG